MLKKIKKGEMDMTVMIRGLRGKASLADYRLTYEGTGMDGFSTVYEPVSIFEYLASSESMQWEIKTSTKRLCSRGTRKMHRNARENRLQKLGLYKRPDIEDLPF